MTSPARQERLVDQAVGELDTDGQYKFALLLLERLLSICREVFPDGLPTQQTDYGLVDGVVSSLWSRVGGVEPDEVAHRAGEEWKPLVGRHIEPRPGAALSFHISDLVSRLATADLDEPLQDVVYIGWEAANATLFRVAPGADYSQSIVDAELDETQNPGLVAEYEAQRNTLQAIGEAPLRADEDLRAESRRIGGTIARLEFDRLRAS